MRYHSAMSRTTVGNLVATKQHLVDFEARTTVGDALQVMKTVAVLAVPVFVYVGEPSSWDDVVGLAVGSRKYVGIVSVLDLAAFVFRTSGYYGTPRGYDVDEARLALALEAPVAQALGSSDESLTLWVEPANRDGLWALEQFAKGVHRALVDYSPQKHEVKLLTQTDLVRYLRRLDYSPDSVPPETLDTSTAMQRLLETPLRHLGAWADPNPNRHEPVVSVLESCDIIPAIHTMLQEHVHAAAVLDNEGRLVSTLSLSDRGTEASTLPWMYALSVGDYLRERYPTQRPPLTCDLGDKLITVMDSILDRAVHRAWIVDADFHPIGVFAMSDILKVVYENEVRLLREPAGAQPADAPL